MEKAVKKQLLEKYMDGLCPEEELWQIELLRMEPGIEQVWDELITERSGKQWDMAIDPDQTMQDIMARRKAQLLEKIAAIPQEEPAMKDDRFVRKLNFLRHAAVWGGLLLIASLAFWQLNKTSLKNVEIAYIEKVNTQGAPVRYVLPDSSEVFLGAGSKLHYPGSFKGATREIELEGEAFFQIAQHADQPFIIHTGNVHTRVLGTSFKVTAFGSREVMVAVATGKVSVNSGDKTLALLTPGLRISWDNQTGHLVREKVDIYNLQQWKNGDMIFDEQLLGSVVAELQRRYNIHVIFKDKEAAGHRVGGTFSIKEPVENIMQMLSMVGEFSYKRSDNKTYIITKQHKPM